MSWEMLFYSLNKYLDAAAGIWAAAAHTNQNISKDGIHGECMLNFLDTRNNITPKYDKRFFFLSDATVKLIQPDTIASTRTRHPKHVGSTNSGENSFFSIFIPWH